MADKNNNQLVEYFVGLSMGQVYAYIGMVVTGTTFYSGGIIGDYLKIAPEMVDRALYSGIVLWFVGTGMYIWRTWISSKERRDSTRVRTNPSIVSLELARTLPPEGMTLQQISDDLAPHPHDNKKINKELKGTINRARIREAAADGAECYCHDGRYYGRNDHTVMG